MSPQCQLQPVEEVGGAQCRKFFGSPDNLIEWRLLAAHNITHVQSKGLFLIQIQRGLMTHVLDRVVVGEDSGWVERKKAKQSTPFADAEVDF